MISYFELLLDQIKPTERCWQSVEHLFHSASSIEESRKLK